MPPLRNPATAARLLPVYIAEEQNTRRTDGADLSTEEVEGDVDLPEVDDLEVAALAAQALPEWLREDGQANSSSSEEYTSSEASLATAHFFVADLGTFGAAHLGCTT